MVSQQSIGQRIVIWLEIIDIWLSLVWYKIPVYWDDKHNASPASAAASALQPKGE